MKEKEDKLRERLKESQTMMKERELGHSEVREAAEYYLNGYEELMFEDKKEIIHHIAREVVVYEDRIQIVMFWFCLIYEYLLTLDFHSRCTVLHRWPVWFPYPAGRIRSP